MLKNKLVVSSAVTFMRAFEILDEAQRKENFVINDDKNIYISTDAILLAVPVLVNGVLACELFLKSFIHEGYRGHDLKEIFNHADIDNQTRDFIKNSVIKIMKDNYNENYDEVLFDKDLEENKNDFISWRYFHEMSDNKKHASYLFIYTLLNVLKALVLTNNS